MWFSFGRSEGFPTQYAALQTAVTVDVLEAGFITAAVILYISFCISLVKSGALKTLSSFVQVTVSLSIGLFLLLENFGQEWEVAEITSNTPYKAGTPYEIKADLGLKIGFRSVNVTLKSDTSGIPDLKGETIDYNERFEWTWDQGRFGFGPYAGLLQREFRAAQFRGVPTPILWIVDYFVIDGEGFRNGRFYRTAGWYCHILLWSAFATWLLANILFRSVIHYGAYALGVTGTLQLTANFVWLVVRNPNELVIPFEDDTLRPKFGISFWFTFVNGIVCLVLSVVVVVMEHYCENWVYAFFDKNPLDDYYVGYLTKEEKELLRPKVKAHNRDIEKMPFAEIPMENLPSQSSTQEEVPQPQQHEAVYFKRNQFMPPPVDRKKKPQHFAM